eukprot:2854178-Prymnesium_polylepis.1
MHRHRVRLERCLCRGGRGGRVRVRLRLLRGLRLSLLRVGRIGLAGGVGTRARHVCGSEL